MSLKGKVILCHREAKASARVLRMHALAQGMKVAIGARSIESIPSNENVLAIRSDVKISWMKKMLFKPFSIHGDDSDVLIANAGVGHLHPLIR